MKYTYMWMYGMGYGFHALTVGNSANEQGTKRKSAFGDTETVFSSRAMFIADAQGSGAASTRRRWSVRPGQEGTQGSR